MKRIINTSIIEWGKNRLLKKGAVKFMIIFKLLGN